MDTTITNASAMIPSPQSSSHFLKLIPVFLLLISGLACEPRKRSEKSVIFSRKDTIAVIQTALDDPKMDSIFQLAFPGQELKLVINEFLNSDYEIVFRNRRVPFVSYDSSRFHSLAGRSATRFYGVVNLFKMLPNNQAKVVLVFHGIGVVADFIVERSDGQWRVQKRLLGQF